MAQLVKQNILVPLDGLSQDAESDGKTLGEDTINFYPDGEGYLVSYPGRVPYYTAISLFADFGLEKLPESGLSTYPGDIPQSQLVRKTALEGKYTRLFIYRDSSGQSHLVYAVDDRLCVAEGKGFRQIYKFQGVARDGCSYPDLFIHENFLIIANLGDPILLWDGYQDVVPLGVTEIPDPPKVSVSIAPWYTDFGGGPASYDIKCHAAMYNRAYAYRDSWKSPSGPHTVLTSKGKDNGWVGGNFSKYGYWGNPGIWYSGPINYEPGGTYHGLGSASSSHHLPENWSNTSYAWKVQYFDRYGNLGPMSKATEITEIPKNRSFMTKPGFPDYNTGSRVSLADFDGKHWATVYWSPPRSDWHIAGCILHKTLDLNPERANSSEVYYQEYVQNNISGGRHTSIAGDSTLSNSPLSDSAVGGPPSTDLGASWGSRVVVRDPNFKEKMLYSDAGQPGQFRPSNVYKARDTIEALIPMGDRILIVTASTSEVLYYTKEGSIAHLETHENKGSQYGRSFSAFGDSVFGLFNDGFFVFDGQSFRELRTPYFLKRDYIDKWHDVQNSVVQGEWYFLSTRKEMVGEDNNHILMCNLPTGRWFQIKESTRDLAVLGDYILGVDDNVYFLFRGSDYPASTIHMNGVLNSSAGILRESTLSSLSLFLEPASKRDVSVTVSGSNTFDEKKGSAVSYPAKSTVSKSVKYYPHYNDGVSTWSNSEWVSPNDFHIEVDLENNITSFKHDIKFSFTGPQRIKAVGIEYSIGGDIASKE